MHVESISLRTSQIKSQLQQLALYSEKARSKNLSNYEPLETSSKAVQTRSNVRGETRQLFPTLKDKHDRRDLSELDAASTTTSNRSDDLFVSGTLYQNTQLSSYPKLSRAKNTFRVELSTLAQCSRFPCSCSCHKQSRKGNSQSWNWLLSSSPMVTGSQPFMARECDIDGCRHRSSFFAVSYAIPIWFLRYKLYLKFTKRPYGSPELLLKMLRMRPRCARIFMAADQIHPRALQRILEMGDGSLLDVSETGESILHVNHLNGDITQD